MIRIRASLIALAALILTVAPMAQPAAKDVVRAKASIEPTRAEPGELITLTIEVEIDPRWHIYAPDVDPDDSLPTTFEPAAPLEAMGDLDTDQEPHEISMAGLDPLPTFAGKVVFTQTLFVGIDAAAGKLVKLGDLWYLACDDKGCLPPAKLPIEAELEILAKEASEESWEDGEVRVDATLEPPSARAGDVVKLVARAHIAPGWHIYDPAETNETAFPTALAASNGWRAKGPLVADHEPHVWELEGVGELRIYEDEVVLSTEVVVPEDAKSGERISIGEIEYIPCTFEYCLDRMTAPVEVSFELLAGLGAGGTDPETTTDDDGGGSRPVAISPEGEEIEKAIARGLPAFMLACAFFALLALLTPCVYPMIPITVSYFTKAAHASRAEAVSHALAYSFGIIATYVGFGVGVRALLGDQGPTWIATYGPINLIVAAVFVAFGLSLLGMFEIRLPDRWVSGMNAVAGRSSGYIGDLLMGFTFTLAAFTCTVPVVAIILRLGVDYSTFHMFLGMLTYATVFAAPFFLLALLPSMLKSMPKSGGWLTSVKVVLAFIELAAAFKFLSAADFYFFPPTGSIFTYTVVLMSWAVLMLLCGVYLLGWIRFGDEEKLASISAPRMLTAASFLVLGLYLAGGAYGKPMAPWIAAFAPPAPTELSTARSNGGGEVVVPAEWERTPKQNGPREWELARAHAAETGQPIFLEYSGFQ